MYYEAYHICNIIFYCLCGISVFLLLFKIVLHILSIRPQKKFEDAKQDHKYAIIVPARNESKVIRQLLESVKAQNYDQSKLDTYLIVESADDPTCEIAKEYDRTHVVVRKHLELKGKGYALDECFQEIMPQKLGYEAYFIFDADNVLDPDYIKEMNKVFDAGLDVGLGYRNSKNWNSNWIAACSGLTFMTFNVYDNRPKSKLGLNVSICGTGFYVSDKVINKLGGWKLFTLTEDYEFRLYTAVNDISQSYNESAVFYDEQPTDFKTSWKQRLRWCKGYSQANKIYGKKLIKGAAKDKTFKGRLNKMVLSLGVLPLAMTLITVIYYQIQNIVFMIIGLCYGDSDWVLPLIGFGASALALYLFLCVYTLVLLILERKHIDITFKNAVVCVLMNPIFMLLYLPIFIQSCFKKEVKWSVIEHNINVEKNPPA